MKELLNELIDSLENVRSIKRTIESNSEYWINKAKEEAGFIPKEGDFISVEIQVFGLIRISVYHKDGKENKHWMNGEWGDTSYARYYPMLSELKREI